MLLAKQRKEINSHYTTLDYWRINLWLSFFLQSWWNTFLHLLTSFQLSILCYIAIYGFTPASYHAWSSYLDQIIKILKQHLELAFLFCCKFVCSFFSLICWPNNCLHVTKLLAVIAFHATHGYTYYANQQHPLCSSVTTTKSSFTFSMTMTFSIA